MEMSHVISNQLDALQREVKELRDIFEQFSKFMAASNHNNVARKANKRLRELRDSIVEPLHHHATNSIIPNFPDTSDEVYDMKPHELRRILEAIGASTKGPKDDLERRLLCHLG